MVDLNLEFSGNVLRILKLNDSKEPVIKKEFGLGFNINDESRSRKNKDDLIRKLEEILNSLAAEGNFEFNSAGILINTEQTFLNVTPIDFNEDISSISSHILWELSNYFPETYKNFNIKYYRLNNNYLNENIDDVLLIGINKSILEFINNLCGGCDLKIRNVEIGHFALEKCLKEDYPAESKNNTILVIGCRDYRFDYSMIVNGVLKNYDFDIYEGSDFKNLLINQINTSGSLFYNIDIVYLYGDVSVGKVKLFLEKQFQNIRVCVIKVRGKEEDSRFAPLYGLALKNLDSNKDI